MAAVSRLQSLTNKASLQNLIHRHLLPPAAASAAEPFNIFPQSQPPVHFDSQNAKLIVTGRFSDNNKLSFSSEDQFLLNRNFISGLPTFDLSLMELRGSRSTSSKKRLDPEEDIEDDFDDDDDDDELKDFDDEFGSCDDDDSDDSEDDFGRPGRGRGRGGGSHGGRGGGSHGGRGGGSRGGLAYTT